MTGKAVFGVILVFVLGCAAGSLGSSIYFSHRLEVMLRHGSATYVEMLERRTTRGLNLDANQKEKIHALFMDNLEQRKKVQAQIQPQIKALNMQTRREIRALLRPEQLETFRNNLQQMRQRLGPPLANAFLTNSEAATPPFTNDSTNAAPEPPAPVDTTPPAAPPAK